MQSLKVYSVADNIISPLGINTDRNFEACRRGEMGIGKIEDDREYRHHFYGAAIDRKAFAINTKIQGAENYTFLEQLFIHSIADALEQVSGMGKSRTLLVLSTTKGNIDLLADKPNDQFPSARAELGTMAQVVNNHFGWAGPPVVVSNACISGLSAIITAKRMIEMGHYDHAVVTGGDLLTKFVVSGFQALMAVSDQPCRPYDAARNGISLGEACGTMILTKDSSLAKSNHKITRIMGGGQSNDANHISGPSRTGAGLQLAVTKALKHADMGVGEIDYINAHGTATIFNDEMEAVAFDAMRLGDIPLNSLKGYFGHTLGAAGVIESIIAMKQMHENQLLASKGYSSSGVSKPLQVIEETCPAEAMTHILKTTSGFGGCNAAVIFEKI